MNKIHSNKNLGIPTNMSMYNCDVGTDYFLGEDYASGKTLCPTQLRNSYPFKEHIVPNEKAEKVFNTEGQYYNLNKLDYTSHPRDFSHINCPKGTGQCGKNSSWVSHDPRLLDPRRNVMLQLDTFPANYGVLNSGNQPSSINMMQIYTDKKCGYGKNYRNYDDITEGDITYYIDKDIQSEFSYPNFTIPSISTGVVFSNPMTNFEPVYTRTQMSGINKDIQIDNYNPLSSIRDTNSHREDIMSYAMAKINKEKYSARYTDNFA